MLNVAVAQINPTTGDIRGNLEKIITFAREASKTAHLVVFPELSISGYFPEDLLLRPDFLRSCEEALSELAQATKELQTLVVVGTPTYEEDLYNSLVVLYKGNVLGTYHKGRLPNYSVFDELRYFREGTEPLLLEVNGVKVGFSICEDIWYPDHLERLTALLGAQVIININASPYHIGKQEFREGFVRARAQDNICFIVYANLTGAHEELVFDGRSMVIDPLGNIVAKAKTFEEDLLVVSLDTDEVIRRRLLDLRWRNASRQIKRPENYKRVSLPQKPYVPPRKEPSPQGEEEIYGALILGTRDYVLKSGFSKAVIGLSGGIDSSLTACIAADALGRENVMGVFMPSRFTSQESFEDAKELADNLGIEFHTVPIDKVYLAYHNELLPALGETGFDIADENIQARIRANILFYISNKLGYMVLSTSNKSESATGYTTVYGDMAGGFAPLKDVYKTWVYKLARYRNTISKVIPERVFKKPPSAELKPDQTDQDTLPPYETLDEILKLYIELNLPLKRIVELGFDRETVFKVAEMVRNAEYKRRQSPVGIKITPRAFGKDWRMPIINRYP